jgi:hypothetical protein
VCAKLSEVILNTTFFAFVILTNIYNRDIFKVIKLNQLNPKFYPQQHKSTVVRIVAVVHYLAQSGISQHPDTAQGRCRGVEAAVKVL